MDSGMCGNQISSHKHTWQRDWEFSTRVLANFCPSTNLRSMSRVPRRSGQTTDCSISRLLSLTSPSQPLITISRSPLTASPLAKWSGASICLLSQRRRVLTLPLAHPIQFSHRNAVIENVRWSAPLFHALLPSEALYALPQGFLFVLC